MIIGDERPQAAAKTPPPDPSLPLLFVRHRHNDDDIADVLCNLHPPQPPRAYRHVLLIYGPRPRPAHGAASRTRSDAQSSSSYSASNLARETAYGSPPSASLKTR
jgi:hypothetical protein